MNNNPAMAQMPAMNAYAMDMGGISQLQPRHTQQRSYYKNKGNRSNGNNSQRTAPPRNSNNHNNNNDVSNGGRNVHGNNAHGKASSAYRNQNNSNRTHNQQQHQINTHYRQHDYSAQNQGHTYAISGRMDLPHQPPNHRKYSNDSGIMIPNSHYRQQGSYPLPIEAHIQDPNLVMSRSSSYESTQQQEYHTHGFHPTHSPGPHSDVDDRCTPDSSVHRQSMQSSHSDAQHSEGSYSPEGPWSAPDVGTPVPSDTTYQFQPTYMVPWIYPQHVVHEFPQMMPLNSHPPQAMSESQDGLEAGRQSPSSSNVTPDVKVSCKDDNDGRDRLREQLEWYFSPRNLATDTYLVSKMNAHHWVPISVITEFKKVKEITDDIQEVVSALRRSSMVLVDDSGSMVKAVTVDRPRTTLILRELPEDTTSEEISGIFADACPAKSVKKESVGNMWFVEFETAEDALAMLMHTRGKYLRDTPIAARLKSNTVLTGGEYRETQKVLFVAGNTAIPGPAYSWPSSPPNLSDDSCAPGFPMPYRRFPAEDGIEGQQLWSPPQVSNQSPQDMTHRHLMEHSYPPDVFIPPNAYGINGQMWIPAPAFAMPLQGTQLDRIYASHDSNYAGELGRNDHRIQSGHDNGEGFVSRKGGYNNRKSHAGGSGEGQNWRHGRRENVEYGRQDFQRYNQREGWDYRQQNIHDGYNYYPPKGYGRYPSKEIPGVTQPIRFSLHGNSRLDLSSTSGFHSYNNIKKKKTKTRNKHSKNQQGAEHIPSDICESNKGQHINDHTTTRTSEEPNCEQAEGPCMEITGGLMNLAIESSIVGVETTSVAPEELQVTTVDHSHDSLDQGKESEFESRTSDPPVAKSYWKSGRNNRRRNGGRQPAKIAQKTPSFELDNFPPLPSTNASGLQGSIPTDLSKSSGRPSHSWVPRSAKAQVNDDEFPGLSQKHPESPSVVDQDSSFASDSNQNQPQSSVSEGAHIGGKSNEESSKSTSVVGVVTRAIEHNNEGAVEEERHDKNSLGEGATKPGGGFSYASALKVQQQQHQREGPVESVAPVVMSNNRV
ncbi:La- protein 4B [Entomortierella chlamydospora]|nr:La- protein 4B [Entomortierella chlamydospora]